MPKAEKEGRQSTPGLDLSGVKDLSRAAVQRLETVQFAGFLVREDEAAVYVADPQGTWVIPREGIAFLEEWEHPPDTARAAMPAGGRAVRVGIKDGVIIQEIRPWQVFKPRQALLQRNSRRVVESVFSLGSSLPVTERTSIGEEQLAALERAFARRLGWDPTEASRDGHGVMLRRAGSVSATIVCTDGECWWGYSDVDRGF